MSNRRLLGGSTECALETLTIDTKLLNIFIYCYFAVDTDVAVVAE